MPVGHVPSRAARRGRRSPDTRSGLVEAVFVRLRVRSRAVPTGLLEGVVPSQHRGLYRGRARRGCLVGLGRGAAPLGVLGLAPGALGPREA